MGLREQGTPDGIRFSISLIGKKEQTTKPKRNERNRIITHQREVGLREQGTPDGIRFGISLIKRTNHNTKNKGR